MAKSKVRKFKFRGAQFREVTMPLVEGQAIVRVNVTCDITPPLAEEFGWEIYQPILKEDGVIPGHLSSGLRGETKLEGELYIEEIRFETNGTGARGLECVATTIKDFVLTRKKDEAGGIETRLKFQMISTSWQLVTDFFGNMGDAMGVLIVVCKPEQIPLQPTLDEQGEQGTLDDDAGDESDAEPGPVEVPKRGKKVQFGTLASRVSGLKVDVNKKPS